MKIYQLLLLSGTLFFGAIGCTDLSEDVYDTVVTDNYYNTKTDVVRAAFRPFEHAFWSIGARQVINEEMADQLGTWNRNGWWVDGGLWQRLHYHTMTADDETVKAEWEACFQGIMQTNAAIDDFNHLNPTSLGLTKEELDNFKAQNKTLRAWFYIRLLDAYRNLPLVTSRTAKHVSGAQVDPQKIFDFVETDLKNSLLSLPMKKTLGGNDMIQGQWTQAGAAALLMRLYLNAEKWIGTAKYNECAAIAQKILDGDYGVYALGDTWDKVFDWDNEKSDEVIFAFPGTFGYSHWHYEANVYKWALPVNAHYYFGSMKQGDHNPKYALQPSLDVLGNPYTFTLGRPVAKFKKYPTDYRLKLYRNLGNSTREGMFLFGSLTYKENGETKYVMSPVGGYKLFIRDQVGEFNGLAPGQIPENTTSDLMHGDHNSGWHFAKYPFYADGEKGQKEADYVEIRLAEVYYSLAECKLRAGSLDEAAILLNTVRKRNYPAAYYTDYLYQPEGNVTLTASELLDEWGREFFAEGRRRTDLIRWNKFCTERWWDKEPDADLHTEILPIHRDILGADRSLKQNKGY